MTNKIALKVKKSMIIDDKTGIPFLLLLMNYNGNGTGGGDAKNKQKMMMIPVILKQIVAIILITQPKRIKHLFFL